MLLTDLGDMSTLALCLDFVLYFKRKNSFNCWLAYPFRGQVPSPPDSWFCLILSKRDFLWSLVKYYPFPWSSKHSFLQWNWNSTIKLIIALFRSSSPLRRAKNQDVVCPPQKQLIYNTIPGKFIKHVDKLHSFIFFLFFCHFIHWIGHRFFQVTSDKVNAGGGKQHSLHF